MEKKYFKILGLKEINSLEEIEEAYRKCLEEIKEEKEEIYNRRTLMQRNDGLNEIKPKEDLIKSAYEGCKSFFIKKTRSNILETGKNGDFFKQLGIEEKERITKEIVEEAFLVIKKEIEEKEEEAYSKRTMEERNEALDKIAPEIKRIKIAYQYCMQDDSISLRNEILELGDKKGILDILEKGKAMKVKSVPTLRQTNSPLTGIEMKDFTIVQLKEFQVIDGINVTQERLKEYQMHKKCLDGNNFNYRFFSEEIDLPAIKFDQEYVISLLRTIELNIMNGENNYIGKIQKNMKDIYEIQKDRWMEQSVEVYNKSRSIKKIERIEEEEKKEWER